VTAELWYSGSLVLPSHDLTLTAGFWGSLGFAIDLGGDGLRLSLGGVDLRYIEDTALDPWAVVAATEVAAYVEVTNADLLHAELCDADVMPDGDAEPAELRARWASDRDVSRLGAPHDTVTATGAPLRAFVVVDPSNNALRCGHPR
jgi:hypothetical protein